MSEKNRRWLLEVFKTLADENRLKMLAYLSQKEHNVGELAALLDIKDPTASHHLSKLRGVGLVSLRTDGTQRFYRLNTASLEQFKQAVNHLEALPAEREETPDENWIDALDLDLDVSERKVLRDYTSGGKITRLPTKFKKFMVILRWLATSFEAGRDYTEKDVNSILMQYHDDFASLRRGLIEAGLLRRESDGTRYWLAGSR